MSDYIKCHTCSKNIPAHSLRCEYCGSIFSTDVDTGSFSGFDSRVQQALKERYKLKGIVGKGGMATVYKAIQLNLNRTVALKVVHENLVHDGEFLKRFIREAQVSASLNHRNIVTVFDVGVAGNIHYMAMEYVPGITLRDYIRKKKRLSIQEIRSFLTPIADALEYIHSRGLIHRDMKSSNIIIAADRRPVLTDFGIVYAGDDNPLSIAGEILGTPEYMSPEQAEGKKELDSRSDIFSFGTILYESATGILPFSSKNPISTINMVINENPVPPYAVNKTLPASFSSLIMDCLQKNRNTRIQKAKLIADALRTGNYAAKNKANDEPKTVKFRKDQIPYRTKTSNTSFEEGFKNSSQLKNTQKPSKHSPANWQKRSYKNFLIIGLTFVLFVLVGFFFLNSFERNQSHFKNLVGNSSHDNNFASLTDSVGRSMNSTSSNEINSDGNNLSEQPITTPQQPQQASVQTPDQAPSQRSAQTVSRTQAQSQSIPSQSSSSTTINQPQADPVNEIQDTIVTPEEDVKEVLTSEQISVLNRFEMKLVKDYSEGDFYIGSTEITQSLYTEIMGTNPSIFVGMNNPVDNVSYSDALLFIHRLNQRYRMNFRLPAQGEWEFAASGGNQGSNKRYSGSNSINDVAVFFDNSSGSSQPVKSKRPNELGLYDMSGNVWEWVQGLFLKGGCWISPANQCRITSRDRKGQDYKDYGIGFRIAHDA